MRRRPRHCPEELAVAEVCSGFSDSERGRVIEETGQEMGPMDLRPNPSASAGHCRPCGWGREMREKGQGDGAPVASAAPAASMCASGGYSGCERLV